MTNDTIQNQLLQDVEESIRREKIFSLWKEYGPSLIAGIVLAILLTGTISAYRAWQNSVFERATIELVTAFEQQDQANALQKVYGDLPGGHRAIAGLVRAGSFLAQGKIAEAQAAYQETGNDGKVSKPYRSLAQLMAIRLAFAQDSGERATQQWLENLSKLAHDKKNPWRYHAEIQAALIAAHDLKDYAQARKWLAPVLSDEAVSAGARQRAQALDSLYAIKATQGK